MKRAFNERISLLYTTCLGLHLLYQQACKPTITLSFIGEFPDPSRARCLSVALLDLLPFDSSSFLSVTFQFLRAGHFCSPETRWRRGALMRVSVPSNLLCQSFGGDVLD